MAPADRGPQETKPVTEMLTALMSALDACPTDSWSALKLTVDPDPQRLVWASSKLSQRRGGKVRGPSESDFKPRPASEMAAVRETFSALISTAAEKVGDSPGLACDVTVFTAIAPHFEAELASSVADGGGDPSDAMLQLVAKTADFLLGTQGAD